MYVGFNIMCKLLQYKITYFEYSKMYSVRHAAETNPLYI